MGDYLERLFVIFALFRDDYLSFLNTFISSELRLKMETIHLLISVVLKIYPLVLLCSIFQKIAAILCKFRPSG